ncbi:unnamed protein product [Cunninghamella echinulata]
MKAISSSPPSSSSPITNDTLINIPPPAYKALPYNNINNNKLSSPPPRYSALISFPPYQHYNDTNDDDSWSIIMKRPFFSRWKYILSSWIPVFQQGKWIFCSCLSCLILILVILIMIIVGTLPHFHH